MWPRSSHPQLPARWFHDEEPTGALWHQNLMAMRDYVQEDQIKHELGTKLAYKNTTHGQQKNQPITKHTNTKGPGTWTKVWKSKISPTPHAGPQRDVPAVAGLPHRQSGCLSDSLTLGFPPISHLGGLRGSEWHNEVSPA